MVSAEAGGCRGEGFSDLVVLAVHAIDAESKTRNI